MKEYIGLSELRKNFPEIKQMMESGLSLREIHKQLTQSGKMTLKFSSFHRKMSKTAIIKNININDNE